MNRATSPKIIPAARAVLYPWIRVELLIRTLTGRTWDAATWPVMREAGIDSPAPAPLVVPEVEAVGVESNRSHRGGKALEHDVTPRQDLTTGITRCAATGAVPHPQHAICR
jgi:hypothetical protein